MISIKLLSLSIIIILLHFTNSIKSNPIMNGQNVEEKKIINGHRKIINSNEFPYVVNLEIWEKVRKRNGKIEEYVSICGGSIITSRTILTAAHCITDCIATPTINILAGILHIEIEKEKAQRQIAQGYYVHEDYIDCEDDFDECGRVGYSLNDIAVLNMKKPLKLGGPIKTAALASHTSSLPKNLLDRKGWIVGWGNTEKSIPSPMLLKGEINSIDYEQCRRLYNHIKITENMICLLSKNRKVSSSLGDSGGPFISNDIVFGTGSFNAIDETKDVKVSDPTKPSIYTNVGKYEEWIKEAVKTLSGANEVEHLRFVNAPRIVSSEEREVRPGPSGARTNTKTRTKSNKIRCKVSNNKCKI